MKVTVAGKLGKSVTGTLRLQGSFNDGSRCDAKALHWKAYRLQTWAEATGRLRRRVACAQ